jgi:dTDP-4-amino-4,6-dideoxygalactose transaminase
MTDADIIPFNVPLSAGDELHMIEQVLSSHKLCGDGPFTKKCTDWFESRIPCAKALLTTSCSHALDMSALLLDISPGDEVIMPSFTFVSTANAFVLRGARIVFVDIRPDTMNIDERLIGQAITPRTKAIVPVHYAGVSCEMDEILRVAGKHGIAVVEDAAQGMMAMYRGRPLGTIGTIGSYSFHETKNYTMGEGGLLIVGSPELAEKAEIIREKGTNRAKFFRGMVDKYTWVEVGSSFLPSELNAAYLYAQLSRADEINARRRGIWERYRAGLVDIEAEGILELQRIPEGCVHNGHMFYIKVRDLAVRTVLMETLKRRGIQTAFHYIPLHDSPVGKRFGVFSGEDKYTTKESERLLRLPLWLGLTDAQIDRIVAEVRDALRG